MQFKNHSNLAADQKKVKAIRHRQGRALSISPWAQLNIFSSDKVSLQLGSGQLFRIRTNLISKSDLKESKMQLVKSSNAGSGSGADVCIMLYFDRRHAWSQHQEDILARELRGRQWCLYIMLYCDRRHACCKMTILTQAKNNLKRSLLCCIIHVKCFVCCVIHSIRLYTL